MTPTLTGAPQNALPKLDLDAIGIFRLYEMIPPHRSSMGALRGDGSRMVRCPSVHHPAKANGERDRHPSCKLNPNRNQFICYACGAAGGMADMVIAAGLHEQFPRRASDEHGAMLWMEEASGQKEKITALLPQPTDVSRNRRKGERLDDEYVEEQYNYTDENGEILFWTVRIVGKGGEGQRDKRFDFLAPIEEPRWDAGRKQWTVFEEEYKRPNGAPLYTFRVIGGFINGQRQYRHRIDHQTVSGRIEYSQWVQHSARGVRIVPFRLPEVRAAAAAHRVIIWPEGERDAKLFESMGFAATANPFGGKFHGFQRWIPYFMGTTAIVHLTDADKAGRDGAINRAEELRCEHFANTVADLWPERNDGYDATNYVHEQIAAGRSLVDCAAYFRSQFAAILRKDGIGRHAA